MIRIGDIPFIGAGGFVYSVAHNPAVVGLRRTVLGPSVEHLDILDLPSACGIYGPSQSSAASGPFPSICTKHSFTLLILWTCNMDANVILDVARRWKYYPPERPQRRPYPTRRCAIVFHMNTIPVDFGRASFTSFSLH